MARDLGAYVALLRGVNVGGKNKIAMTALAGLFEEAGCSTVRCYIQSGNVVFRAPAARVKKLSAAVSALIAERFSLSVPVILRSAEELRAVSRSNPFLAEGAEARLLHVAFLAEAPAAPAVHSLDTQRSPPDRFVVAGKEVYLMLPNGVGKTRLTNAYLDAKLRTTSTLRNWRTVLQLVELTAPQA